MCVCVCFFFGLDTEEVGTMGGVCCYATSATIVPLYHTEEAENEEKQAEATTTYVTKPCVTCSKSLGKPFLLYLRPEQMSW